MDVISTRIPRHIVGQFIRWCKARHVSQSEVIRQALAWWIMSDTRATSEDMALAASIRDVPPRLPREYRAP